MRKVLPLSAAAVAAFGLSLLVWLPAGLLSSWLPPQATVGNLSGSVWHGHAAGLAFNGQSLGALEWRLRPLQILRGRLALDGQLTRADGDARARIALGLGGGFEAIDFDARWPLSALPRGIAPPGWQGDLNIALPRFSLGREGVAQIKGQIEVRNLRAPPPGGAAIGSYQVTFDDASAQGAQLVGQLRDLEGPMAVSGTLVLGPGRNYVVGGMVAPRAGAPPAVTDTLRFLGNPDAQGRRPFSIGGSY